MVLHFSCPAVFGAVGRNRCRIVTIWRRGVAVYDDNEARILAALRRPTGRRLLTLLTTGRPPGKLTIGAAAAGTGKLGAR